MTPLRALAILLWFAIVSTGAYVWTMRSAPQPVEALPPGVDTTAVLDEVVNQGTKLGRDTARDWSQPHADLYGNAIDDAVGDYRVAPGGDLYEDHAPDTAVTRLGPPRL